jgi:hypothetical protein
MPLATARGRIRGVSSHVAPHFCRLEYWSLDFMRSFKHRWERGGNDTCPHCGRKIKWCDMAMFKLPKCAKWSMQPICTHTISLQSSKPSHAYPIIRLPREFSNLAGAKGTVLQTIYKGALAFLVVINDRPLKESVRAPAKRMQKYEPLHGEGHRFESGRAHCFSAIWLLIAHYFENWAQLVCLFLIWGLQLKIRWLRDEIQRWFLPQVV